MGVVNGRAQELGNMLSALMLTSIGAFLRMSSSVLAVVDVLAAPIKASFVDLLTTKSPDRGSVG